MQLMRFVVVYTQLQSRSWGFIYFNISCVYQSLIRTGNQNTSSILFLFPNHEPSLAYWGSLFPFLFSSCSLYIYEKPLSFNKSFTKAKYIFILQFSSAHVDRYYYYDDWLCIDISFLFWKENAKDWSIFSFFVLLLKEQLI